MSELLAKAKELLEKYGWTQRDYGGAFLSECIEPMCAVGAIRQAAGQTGDTGYFKDPEVLKAFDQLVRSVCGNAELKLGRNNDEFNESLILIWNDHESRTKEEVLAAFDRAIELEGDK